MNYAAIAAPAPGSAPHAAADGGQAAPAPRPAPQAQPAAPQLGPIEREVMDKRAAAPSTAAKNQDFLYKRRLILKIRQYATAFPEECGKQVSGKDLENLTEPDLECLMQEIKFTVGSRASSIVTNQMAGAGLVGLESVLKEKFAYEVAGPEIRLSQIMASEDCQYLVKELSLEYMDIIYTRPEIRAGVYLFNAVNTIDVINRRAIDGEHDSKAALGKRKQPEEVKAPQETPPEPPTQRPRTEEVPGALVIQELPAVQMPIPPIQPAPAVVIPAVLRQPAPSPKPKPAPHGNRK